MTSQILVVDDDEHQCALLESCMEGLGLHVRTTSSSDEALELARRTDFGAVLTDVDQDGTSCIELCHGLRHTRPDIPIIVMTAFGAIEHAISAMRAGAYDIVAKPVDYEVVSDRILRAVKVHRMQAEFSRLRGAPVDGSTHDSLVGDCPAMRRVRDLIARVSQSEASVLIQGETGTGKELVARAIHARGPRKNGPFVAINCAAMPASLLESELFGHARGAFTDAKTSHPGLFAQAGGGTLFLDEIGDMPLEMQTKLLRALQERVVRPVGGEKEVPFDARLLAATHRDLESQTEEQRFRRDLYYRINVVRIDVPPLRERASDVIRLAAHFLETFRARRERPRMALAGPAAERLVEYDWPGNVRELENCLECAVTLARGDQIMLEDLPEKIRVHRPKRILGTARRDGEVVALDVLERRHIHHVLKLVDGNKSRAAHLLGLDRRTLYRKLERYSSDRAD